jgi:hypothetical protein
MELVSYMLTKPQIRVVLTVLNDLLGELISMCKYVHRSCLTTVEAMQFAKAKINKLRAQYLGERVYWSD